MSKINDISIQKAPLFFSFLKQIIAFDGSLEIAPELHEKLFITGQCECGQKDCATVYLRLEEEWNPQLIDVYLINTNKGLVIIHLEENGYMEVEALEYDDYPYQAEIKRVLAGDFSAPTDDEYLSLENYFKDIENEEIIKIIIDE